MKEKKETIKFLGLILAGCLSALAVIVANKRANAMANDVKVTESGNRQERLRDAVNHLGNESSSVRQGGFHSLLHLAFDHKDLRSSIVNILCAHIRETTSDKEGYQEKHKNTPSTEIQSLLSLLFTAETHSMDKLEDFWQGLTPDLSGGYFQGVKLQYAFLKGVDLDEAQLQGADLWKAQLQEVSLWEAQLQGANLSEAQLQGADLWKAQLQGADLSEAQLQGAYILKAQLQGADLWEAQLQGANLWEAQLQGANLQETQLQGAVSSEKIDYNIPFHKLIMDRVGKDSNLSKVVFEGGIDNEDIDKWFSILKTIKDYQTDNLDNLDNFREKLRKHVGLKISHQPPDGVITGNFNEEKAKEWVAEYKKAMATVQK